MTFTSHRTKLQVTNYNEIKIWHNEIFPPFKNTRYITFINIIYRSSLFIYYVLYMQEKIYVSRILFELSNHIHILTFYNF